MPEITVLRRQSPYCAGSWFCARTASTRTSPGVILMSRIQLLLMLSAIPLVSCGEDEIKPEGPHYTYVVSEARVPTSNPEATEFGLDLNGDRVNDNQLGAVLAALKSQGFDVQGAITEAVDQGDIILLVDLQTPSFSSSGGTGLQIKLGDPNGAMPAACAGTSDTTCRKHLDGNGSFSILAGSPDNIAVAGKVVGGTLNAGPGNISLQIALGGDQGIQLDLIGARAKATGMSDTRLESVILAGALTETDLNTKVIPAIHAQLLPIVAADCTNMTPPACGCADGSTGKTVMNLFDTMPKDCILKVEEIQNNSLIKSLLAPDVEIDGQAALSLGIKVTAVKGTIR